MSDQPNNALLAIDLEKRQVVDKIDLGESPKAWEFLRTGNGSSPQSSFPTRWRSSTPKPKVEFNVKTKGQNPEHAVFSPDGKWVYVSVDVIDVAKRQQVAQVPVGKRPRGIGFLPDGAVRALLPRLRAKSMPSKCPHKALPKIKAVRNFSNGVAVHPSGKRVYVSDGKDTSVSVIDTSTNKIVTTIPVGKRPWNMAITPDGKKLYVANGRSDSVSVIDTETNQKIKGIPVGERPWGVVIR